jgi:hypothetical protein
VASTETYQAQELARGGDAYTLREGFGVTSPLIELLKDELTVQRVFLSSDEERALDRIADDADGGDLAFERVKARRYLFYAALRDRFVYDGRPIRQWLDWIATAETSTGDKPTIITALATRVVEWSIRASDRTSMFLGFATGLVRWFAFFLLALGGWAWTRDFAPAWWVICTLGVGFWLGARFLKRFTDRRVSAVVQATRERYAQTG